MLKKIATKLAKTSIRAVFYLSSALCSVKNDKVTFASYRTEQLKGNLLYLHEELLRQKKDLTVCLLFKKYHSSILGKIDYLLHLLRASYHLATSRYFFIDDFYFPVYVVKPRPGTEVVQLWHAAGAFKKFGYSTIGKTFGPTADYLNTVRVHSNYAKVMVSCKEVIPYYAEAFNMSQEGILPLGLPRTDFFFQEQRHEETKARFYRRYPELKGKSLVLYAPTFRGKSHYQEGPHVGIDFFAMQEELGPEYAVLVHLHPYSRDELPVDSRLDGFLYCIRQSFSVEELMILSDILVTDYSAVIFDFSLLCRPIAFFADDLESYIQERDFYFDYEQFIPGPLFRDARMLAQWIKRGDFDTEIVADFRDRFFDHIDGKASERIVNYLFKGCHSSSVRGAEHGYETVGNYGTSEGQRHRPAVQR